MLHSTALQRSDAAQSAPKMALRKIRDPKGLASSLNARYERAGLRLVEADVSAILVRDA
jgi:hypothetical protein